MWETWVWSLVWEDPLEKGKTTHSSILAWRIACKYTVHGVTKSQMWLSNFHFHFFHFHMSVYVCVCSVTQSCPTLCDPMNCSLPGSSVHGILQERIMEWVAISSSRGSSWPCLLSLLCWQGGFFTTVPPGNPLHIRYIIESYRKSCPLPHK